MRCAAASLLLGVFACASTAPAPAFHDERYLRFGVDPKEEELAVIESQKARQYEVGLRIQGQHFTALGFMDKGGRSTAVRILTVRGTIIALDSRPERGVQPAKTYALLAPPISDTYDADRDGFDEVFVEERTPGKACLQVYRVRDVGFVDRVVVDSRVFGQEVCARAAIDLDIDGIVELVTEIELAGFPRAASNAPARRLFLPLWVNQHQFVARAGTPAQRAWLTQQRTRREAELQEARGRLDVATSYALGIELAALTYLGGGDRDAQVGVFDRALEGLVLQVAQADANQRARSRIYTEWNQPGSEATPAAAPAAAGETRAAKVPSEPASAAQLKAARPREVRRASEVPAGYDGPPLAEGDLVITPESAAADARARPPARTPAPANAAAPAPAPSAPSALDSAEVVAYRNTARELGNAAVAARARAADARRAGAAERQAAQQARARAAEATDPAIAAELRKTAAEHAAAAERHAAEATEHSAEAARQRAALEAHRAKSPSSLARPPN